MKILRRPWSVQLREADLLVSVQLREADLQVSVQLLDLA